MITLVDALRTQHTNLLLQYTASPNEYTRYVLVCCERKLKELDSQVPTAPPPF